MGTHTCSRGIDIAKDEKGIELGTYNPEPVLDTRIYEVIFPDGAVEQYAASLIAENLIDQVDEEG